MESGLGSEIIQFAHVYKSVSHDAPVSSVELEMFQLIHEHDMIESFANIEILLRLYLCMFVTNCTGERSFSKLKLVKNYVRNSMGQERLTSLTLLSIENEKLKQFDFTNVISQFAAVKAREKPL